MKYLSLFAFCAILLTSCGDSAQDTRQMMENTINGEDGKRLLNDVDRTYWKTIIKTCGDDQACLEKQYDKLLDQLAERQVNEDLKNM